MAGDSDGHRVSCASIGYSASGGGPADLLRDLRIRINLARRDLLQEVPDPELEGSGAYVERQIQLGAVAFQVFGEGSHPELELRAIGLLHGVQLGRRVLFAQ